MSEEFVSPEFQEILEGMDIPCDLRVPSQPPSWLDKDAFFRGQKYFRDNMMAILVGLFRNLVLGLFVQNLCDPLVMTRRSETSSKARKRYIDTFQHLCTWYRSIPWEDATSFEAVCRYHRIAANLLKDSTREERNKNAKEIIQNLPPDDRFDDSFNDLLRKSLQKFERDHPAKSKGFFRYQKSDSIFSQFDMGLVHMAFFQTVVLFPDAFGASQADLDGFVHFWRVVGYYLGIEDKFNFARMSLTETRKVLKEVTYLMVVPCVAQASDVSFHMANAVTKGFSANLNLIIYSHFRAYGLELEGLWEHFPWKLRLIFYIRQFIVCWLYTLPGVRTLFNWMMSNTMERMIKA